MTQEHRFSGHDPQAGHDTHGVPWKGRSLPPTPFAGDTGKPAAGVREGLRRLLTAQDREAAEAAEADLVAVLADARVFVPVVAEPAVRTGVEGLAADDRSDMASVVLTAPDGRRALPVFSGVDTLSSWDAAGRPVPVAAAVAARAAADDACSALLVDLGADDAVVLRLSHLWALAQARPWTSAHRDPLVAAAAAALPGQVAHVQAATLAPGETAGVVTLVLTLTPALTEAEAGEVVAAAGQALVTDPEVRVRIDALTVALRSDDARPV